MQPAASRPGLHGEQKPAKPNSNPYEAEATNPVAEMFSPKTFLTAAYLLFSFPLALIGFVVAILGLAAGIPLTLIWIGIFLLIGTIAVLHGLWNVERKLCYWLLGVEIPYRSHPDPYQSRIQKVLSLLTSRSTWKGLVYTFINFHWSLLCFVLVITLYAVPAVLLAAPVLVSQRWLDLNLLGVEINSFSRAIGAALLGLPLFYVGVKLTRGLGYVSGKLAKIFLSRY